MVRVSAHGAFCDPRSFRGVRFGMGEVACGRSIIPSAKGNEKEALMKTNETIETIFARRSVRSFTDEPIAREDLEAIASCGPWAPSGMNRQEWTFTVVTDRARLAALANVVGEVLGREGYDMYSPAAVIIVSHVKGSPWGKQDDACAMQNMMLAATSLGIGSVWINQLEGVCDDGRIRAQLDALAIPEDHEVHGLVALGYAAAEPRVPIRKDVIRWVD